MAELARGLRVLHVDDDAVNRRVLDDLLGLLGCRSTAAASGAAALEALAAGTFDLLMTDIHMPQMSGHALLAAVRARGLDLPVIAVTADLVSHSPGQYRDLGFHDVLRKPLESAAIRRALEPLAVRSP